MLASTEFIEGHLALTFVSRTETARPLQRFLVSIGIHSTACTIDELADRLRPDALHIFVVETTADADGFLRRFAGRQCEQQLLVVDRAVWSDPRGKELMAYSSVTLGDDFAHRFFEVFGSKLAKLVHETGAVAA